MTPTLHEAAARLASMRDECARVADGMDADDGVTPLARLIVRRHVEDMTAVLDELAKQAAKAERLRGIVDALAVCADFADDKPQLTGKIIRGLLADAKAGDAP